MARHLSRQLLRPRICGRVNSPLRYNISNFSVNAAPSENTQVSPEEYDVVIVGGGPAGLALAGALTSYEAVRDNLRIGLVEAGDFDRIRAWSQEDGTYSNRVSSITNESMEFLQDIGAWQLVEEPRTAPVHDMQVWDGVSDARIYFSANQTQSSEVPSPTITRLATMTENLNIQRALLRLLDNHTQVQLLDKVKVDAILPDANERGGWPLVKLSNGRTLRARLLVGADGFNSPVKKYAGIQTYGWSYDTHAVVATLNHSPLYPGIPLTAFQRFLPTGPIAFLPLSATSASLVWSTRPHLAQALKQLEPDAFRRMVNAAFRLPALSMQYLHDRLSEPSGLNTGEIAQEIRWREEAHDISPHSNLSSSFEDLQGAGVGGYGGEVDIPPLVTSVQHGSVAGFPLRMSHAEEYIGTGQFYRTALVGDAAHTVHPLAGQGLNMGLADVRCLANCIRDAVTLGADIGSRTALLPYPSARYFENHKLISATDKLHKIYSTQNPSLVWARSVGLEVINELPFVKNMLTANAGSTSGRREGASGDRFLDVAAGVIEFTARTAETGTSVLRVLATAGGSAVQSFLRR